MADVNTSKSSKKNKKRAQKRLDARLEKLKQEGVVQQVMELEDPITTLKKKLQLAKENQDHKLAADLRQQIWMIQDKAAGYSVPETEYLDAATTEKLEDKTSSSIQENTSPNQNVSLPESGTSISAMPIEKRLRTLKKKLQQINNLKEKQNKGETLEETQIRKVNTEDDIIAEIKEIESALASMSL